VNTSKSLIHAPLMLAVSYLAVHAGGDQGQDYSSITVKTVTSSDGKPRSARESVYQQTKPHPPDETPRRDEAPTIPHDDTERLAKEWLSFRRNPCETHEPDNPELERWCARSLHTTLNWLIHLSQDTSEPPTPQQVQGEHHPTTEELEELESLEELRLAPPLPEATHSSARCIALKELCGYLCSCPCCDNPE